MPSHPARRAVEVIQHLLALYMNKMTAWQTDVPIGGVEQSLKADWAP